jgi:hypothetical protein
MTEYDRQSMWSVSFLVTLVRVGPSSCPGRLETTLLVVLSNSPQGCRSELREKVCVTGPNLP